MKFRFWGGIPVFLGQKCTFPVLGLQKSSQNLVFIKGLARGPGRSHSGPQRALLGSRNAKRGGIPPFLQNGRASLKTGRASLKKDQETIGLRKGWGKCKMVKFHEIPTFYVKFLIFHRKRKNIFVTSATFPVFRTLAARMRQP